MTKYDMFGAKKNVRLTEGKMVISESQVKEFTELGIIQDGQMVGTDGTKTSYEVGEDDAEVFQFHIPKSQWGKTYNLISEPMDEGGRRKIIYVPDKERFEIWENPKGGKRSMVKRVEGNKNAGQIVKEWNERYGQDLKVKELREAIK